MALARMLVLLLERSEQGSPSALGRSFNSVASVEAAIGGHYLSVPIPLKQVDTARRGRIGSDETVCLGCSSHRASELKFVIG